MYLEPRFGGTDINEANTYLTLNIKSVQALCIFRASYKSNLFDCELIFISGILSSSESKMLNHY